VSPDPFGTAALRAAALDAWRASPARLREDANVEEDHARGYYRDRVVVELAQNAADAAARAGEPGRLLLRLARVDGEDGPRTVLVAANTGAPLDEAGVASLATMRASAKRDGGLVGRYGVGFAAVRAVADEVSVLSTSGGVRFSLHDTAALLAEAGRDVPALAEEVRRRDGSLPALRLPLATDGEPPEGYVTAVVLELRDEVAADEVRALLREVDDPLLLALPALAEVRVEDLTEPDPQPRVLEDVGSRWLVARAGGTVPDVLLAQRPVEERAADRWEVAWALRRDGAVDLTTQVVHAPTPTDEHCALPPLLVATLPLDPTRRRVATGGLTDFLLDHAAGVYVQLAQLVARESGDALALVPVGLPGGAVDSVLRSRVADRLAHAPLLRAAEDPGRLVAPARAVAVEGTAGRDPAALAELGRRVSSLVRVPPGRDAHARTVGVEVRSLADVVDELPTAGGGWRALYAALEPVAADAGAREALAGLPVPLVDGRVVRGARGLLLLDDACAQALGEAGAELLARWGLRLVDPREAHPLLERVGAQAADAASLLAHPAVRRAVVAGAPDEDGAADDERLVDVVLGLVGAATRDGSLPAEARAWLGLILLRADDDEPATADSLLLPGSPAAELLDDRVLAPVHPDLVARWGADVLAAVGVRADLVVTHVPDVLADPASVDEAAQDPATLAALSLDGWTDYLDALAERLGAGAYVGDVHALADLDAVHPDRWPGVLGRLASDRALRAALLEPVRAEGGTGTAPSYTAWWLRERSGLDLARPFAVRAAQGLDAVLPPAPAVLDGLDDDAQRALGGVTCVDDLDGPGWRRLLDGWGPAGTPVAPATAAVVWRSARPDEPPERLPALVGPDRVAVVHADDAAVAPEPMWWQRTDVAALVPAAPGTADELARLLDLPRVDALAAGRLDGAGRPARVPREVAALVPGATEWVEHDDLRVDGVPVEWWIDDVGTPHAVHLAGLAAALAQSTGRWALRHAVEAVLVQPGRAAELALDAAWEA